VPTRSLVLLLVTAAAACAPREGLISQAHETMGSEVRVTLRAGDRPMADAAFAEIFAEFDRLDALLSVWKSGSDVLRINAAAGKSPVRVSNDTIAVLEVAHRVSVWTAGKFDVTFGALADVWKFDHDKDERVPSREEIAARLPLVDYRAVLIDSQAQTAFLSRSGMRIHLGGIGKGYAVDRAVGLLRARGVSNFMIQFGGDLYVAGEADEGPWRIGINDPRGAGGDSFATAELRDETFSTSGDYERFFIKDGTRYHHILDPATGQPARGCRSVTLVAASATLADAIAKGVFILGPHAGMELVERLADVEAVIVSAENEVSISSGLRGRITTLHPPTDRRP
jgi:thiamine biosynthesis lipoprotein